MQGKTPLGHSMSFSIFGSAAAIAAHSLPDKTSWIPFLAGECASFNNILQL